MNSSFLSFLLILLLSSCQARQKEEKKTSPSPEPEAPASKAFSDYWYQGKAELSRFELEQARYGEVHTGNAVMIFVTEDLLTETQVKQEQATEEEATKVLKLNFVRDFTTGIYDYNMMTSVFSPVDRSIYSHALKVSTSAQEWCGHAYLQLNNREEGYHLSSHSYFQEEADQDMNVEKAYLEDELWTLLRLAPFDLPLGEFSIIPGTMYTRLMHKAVAPVLAKAALDKYTGEEYPGENLLKYRVHYPSLERTLSIYFEKAFPHKIAGWEETYSSGFGDGKKELTTKAVRTHSIQSAYWKKNGKKDRSLRKQLGLPSE